MKKSSRRALSRVLAGVMVVSTMLTNMVYADTTADEVSVAAEAVASGAAVESTAVEEDVVAMEAATPVAGKTYIFDFGEANTYDTATMTAGSEDGIIKYTGTASTTWHSADYGMAVKTGDKVEVAVAGNAKISFQSSQYAPKDAVYAVTDASGADRGTMPAYVETDKTDSVYKYEGDATTLTFTYTSTAGQGYLKKVTVENEAEPIGEAKNFEVWIDDLAGEAKSLEAGEIKLEGDSKLTLIGNGSTAFTPEIAAGQDANFSAVGGREKANAYKAGPRHATANDIPTIPEAGAGTAVIFTPAANGMFNTYFYSTSFVRVWDFDTATGERYGYVDSDTFTTAIGNYAFDAKAGHTYVLSTTGKTNNCAFAGFEYFVDDPVTVDFTFDGYDIGGAKVNLVDIATGQTKATVDKTTTSAELVKDHTYVVKSNDGGRKASVGESDRFKCTGDPVTITIAEVRDVTLSGKVTSDDPKFDMTTVKGLVFTSNVDSSVSYSTDKIAADGAYSLTVKPGDYTTTVLSDVGHVTKDHVLVEEDTDKVNEVYIEPVDTSMIYLPDEIENPDSKVKFNDVSGKMKKNNATSIAAQAGDSVVIPVSGKQRVIVSGWYSGTWDINGQNSVTTSSSANDANPTTNSYDTNGTETSVTINLTGEGVTNYLYWVQIKDIVPYAKEIKVPGDYATMKDAIDAIKYMDRPEGEDGRVTISLQADIQEQVLIDVPYITISGNDHEINWYYGQTGFYYSVDDTGYYNETLFRDAYSKKEASGSLWGGVVIVTGDNFKAENVTFRNTFNYEVTDKEILDGAEGRGNLKGIITKDTDVQAYAAKERSNALYVNADNIECVNCNILSSQDTLGVNGERDYKAYFKNCTIGGNVDYICGAGAMVFDNCELQWKTYTNDTAGNNAKIGYICAPKSKPYVFRNCVITTDLDDQVAASEDAEPVQVVGMFGRTWGVGSKATFINTETNGHIAEVAWGEMSSGEYFGNSEREPASFIDYNTTSNGEPMATRASGIMFDENGKLMDSSIFVPSPTLSGDDINLLTDEILTTVLGGWTPGSYEKAPEGEDPIENLNIKYGDVDKDGVLTANDAAATLQYTLNKSFNGVGLYDFIAADVDGNGEIQAADAAIILQKVLMSTYKMPVEPAPQAATVYVVGDSTGCDYAPTADTSYYYKRVGFGTMLSQYLAPEATVVNYALSGRSSKSFTTEQNYKDLLANMKEGDYLIIAFGHNDEKADDAARYTEPLGDKDTEGSFKNSLYVNYIQPAQKVGATPILATPVVRRTTGDTWSDNQLHVANGKSYAEAVKELGAELNVTVIDNTQMTKDLYDQLTPAETLYLHAWLSSNPASVDNTHLNKFGASYVAYMMADALKNSGNKLGDYVGDIQAPTKDILEVNPEYKEPEAADPEDSELVSDLFTTTSPWYAAAFGDIGGISKLRVMQDETPTSELTVNTTSGKTNFEITELGSNSVRIRTGDVATTQSFGKLTDTTDAFTMYYQPVDAASNFEISATATVNDVLINSQVSFGAVCVDKVLTPMNENSKDPMTYVAAGAVKYSTLNDETNQMSDAFITFAKNASEGKIVSNAKQEYVPKAGDVVNVKLTKVGDKITTTYGDVTETYEVPMSGKVYIGLYTTRNADVTFSNIAYSNEVTE